MNFLFYLQTNILPTPHHIELTEKTFSTKSSPADKIPWSLFVRYCAVCHPYTYRDLTHARTVGKRVTTYVVPVLTFSVILNIPKFFETKLVTSKGPPVKTEVDCVLYN